MAYNYLFHHSFAVLLYTFSNVLKMKLHFVIKWYIPTLANHRYPITFLTSVFFLSGFSFTDTDNSQDSKGREGTIFYSTLPLPPAHEQSDIYLQLCTWNDYHIILMATLVFTRLPLDEISHPIELLFDWLMMWCWFWFVCLLIWF